MASTRTLDSEPVARRYGRYELLCQIGDGGMATVWAARSDSTGAEVALKVIPAGVDNDRARARFHHEAQLAGRLQHRNVVKIFDFFTSDDGASVLVMELLRGESLASMLERRGRLQRDEAVAVMLAILSALRHTHAERIVHRDIKPNNIFIAVDPDGHVTPKLLDFGIARLPEVSPTFTVSGDVLGTPRYMSPEQIRSARDIDGRGDLFAVAAVLLELLTGRSPFAADTPGASLAAVLERKIDPDPDVAPRLFIEIERALRKRPYERHASAAELAEALRAATSATDAELEAALQGLAPTRELPRRLLPQPMTTLSGRTRQHRITRLRRTILGVSLVFASLTALLVGSKLRGEPARPTRAEPPAAALVPAKDPVSATEIDPAKKLPPDPVPPSLEPTGARPSIDPGAGASSGQARPTSSGPSRAPQPVRPPPPRPVATTPGF